MFLSDENYIKFLQNPHKYLKESLVFGGQQYNADLRHDYPVVLCGDIELHFNHSKTFEDAVNKWNERKERINWDNIFVMMYTEEEETASRFAELPYEKKICFVPFQNGHECCCQVKFAEEDKMQFDKPFWALVNGMADGTYLYYDAVDLLLNADVKRLVQV